MTAGESHDIPQEILRNLPAWRAEHGVDLYYVPQCGAVVRPAKRSEALVHEIQTRNDPTGADIYLAQQCVIHPSWDSIVDTMSLPDFHSLCRAIWRISGFSDPEAFERDLNEMRVLVQSRDHAVLRTICAAFKYTFEEINEMPRDQILYLLAQAESAIGMTYDGRPMAEVMPDLLAQAEAERLRELSKLKAMGYDIPGQTRFFDWIKDLRELKKVDR